MTREETVLRQLAGAVGLEIPEQEAPQWFKDAAYELGVEPDSGSLDLDNVDGWTAYTACRVDGQPIRCAARGKDKDDAIRKVLKELEKAVARLRDPRPRNPPPAL